MYWNQYNSNVHLIKQGHEYFLFSLQKSSPTSTRQGLFHSPGPTAPLIGKGTSRNRENSAVFLPVKLCSRNSWRGSSTEYFRVCLKGAFWEMTGLNEADIPSCCLGFDTSLRWIFQGGLNLSTFYVVLGVPVKEVCYYFIKPVKHLRPWSKSYCPILMCG